LAKLQGLKEVVTQELAKQRGMLQDHPNDPDVHYRLAKVEARAGDLKGAIRDYQKTLDLRPDNGSPHADLAEMYLLSGDKDSAWAEVKKARAQGTEPPASLIARLGPQK
jgi:Flp pilus assembly protein TadD